MYTRRSLRVAPVSIPTFAIVFTAVLLLLMAGRADATPIQFITTGTGAGTLNGTPFTASDFTITSLGDTATRSTVSPGIYSIDHLASSITIDNLGTFAFVTPTRTFVNQSSPVVGFSRAGNTGSDLYTGPVNPAFATWDMLTPIGPLVGTSELLQWTNSPVITSGGTLVFTNADTRAVFTATLVPEPSTLLLLSTSALLLFPRRRARAA